MDSVRDPSAFRELSEEFTRLASQRYAEPLPLEELFLEGPMSEVDRSTLIASLVHLPSLRRLALYQARRPTPTLYNEIYQARPDLKSLTIVGGDCDGSILFPAPLVRLRFSSYSTFANVTHRITSSGGLSPIFGPVQTARILCFRSSKSSLAESAYERIEKQSRRSLASGARV